MKEPESLLSLYRVILMAKTNTTEILEALAAEIGENVYMDIAKWHLYLSNAKLHTVVAEQMYPLITSNSVDEDRVIQILESIPVKIGGGRREISLIDLLPIQCQVNLVDILEKYQREI
jgi:Protein of unknown function (DUF3181)